MKDLTKRLRELQISQDLDILCDIASSLKEDDRAELLSDSPPNSLISRLRLRADELQSWAEETEQLQAELLRLKAQNDEEQAQRVKAETLQRLQAELLRLKEQYYKYYGYGLPILFTLLCASPSSSRTAKGCGHGSISPTLETFSCFDFDKDFDALASRECTFSSNLFDSKRKDAVLPWMNEAHLHSCIFCILHHVVSLLNLSGKIMVTMEQDLDQRCNPIVFVIRRACPPYLPICVVFVKKPDIKPYHDTEVRRASFEDNSTAEQLLDCMVATQERSGIDHVFGILTDFIHWRPFWLPGAEDSAKSSILPNADTNGGIASQSFLELETLLRDGKFVLDFSQPAVPIKLFAGNTHTAVKVLDLDATRDGTRGVIRMLATVILKAYHSPRTLSTISHLRVYRRLTVGHMDFTTLSDQIQLSVDMPVAKAQKFTLLQSLGGGGDGNAYWVCTDKGRSAALKLLFYSKYVDQKMLLESAQEEAEYWKSLWGVEMVRAIDFGERVGVLMPLVHVLSKEEVTERKEEVLSVIRNVAQKKLVHCDLRWRHVAELKNKNGEQELIFIDLSRMDTVEDEEEAYMNMKEQLEKDLALVENIDSV